MGMMKTCIPKKLSKGRPKRNRPKDDSTPGTERITTPPNGATAEQTALRNLARQLKAAEIKEALDASKHPAPLPERLYRLADAIEAAIPTKVAFTYAKRCNDESDPSGLIARAFERYEDAKTLLAEASRAARIEVNTERKAGRLSKGLAKQLLSDISDWDCGALRQRAAGLLRLATIKGSLTPDDRLIKAFEELSGSKAERVATLVSMDFERVRTNPGKPLWFRLNEAQAINKKYVGGWTPDKTAIRKRAETLCRRYDRAIADMH